jgi:hypothetical protein
LFLIVVILLFNEKLSSSFVGGRSVLLAADLAAVEVLDEIVDESFHAGILPLSLTGGSLNSTAETTLALPGPERYATSERAANAACRAKSLVSRSRALMRAARSGRVIRDFPSLAAVVARAFFHERLAVLRVVAILIGVVGSLIFILSKSGWWSSLGARRDRRIHSARR